MSSSNRFPQRTRKATKFLMGNPNKLSEDDSISEASDDSDKDVLIVEASDDNIDDDDDFDKKSSKRKKSKAATKQGRGNSKIAKVSIDPEDAMKVIASGDIAGGAAVEDVDGDDPSDFMGDGAAVKNDDANNDSDGDRSIVTLSVSELVSAASTLSQVADNESGTAFAKRLIDKINSKGDTKQACDLSEDLGKLLGVNQVSLNSQSAPDRVSINSNISYTLSRDVGPGTIEARSSMNENSFGHLLESFSGISVSNEEGTRDARHFPHECIAFAQIRTIYSHNLVARSKALERPGLDNHTKSVLGSLVLGDFDFSTFSDQVTPVLDMLEYGEDQYNSQDFKSLPLGFQYAFEEMWSEANTYGDDDANMDEQEQLEREIEEFHNDRE